VKIDPGIAGFSQQDAGFAAPRVYLQQLQCLLIARLSLYRQELAAREPVHARQVDIRFLADIHPAQVGTVGRNHSEPYEYVRRAGRRIALLVNLEVLGIYLEPLRHVHGGFVDADKSDRRVVRRPPVTGVSVHLFLGDEFGHAVANEPAAVMGQPELVEGVQVDGEEVLVANEGHVPAGGAELRVGLTRLGVGELSCLVTVEIVEEQVTVEREQQAIRASSPATSAVESTRSRISRSARLYSQRSICNGSVSLPRRNVTRLESGEIFTSLGDGPSRSGAA
jgi:hypothetical protein